MSHSSEFRKYAVHHLGMSGNALDSYAKYLNENPYTVTGMTPNVVEERQMRATVIDVFSRLMADRIIFFGTAVDDYVANVITPPAPTTVRATAHPGECALDWDAPADALLRYDIYRSSGENSPQ